MSARVHILATVRNPSLLDAALLVFRSLRKGFPNAPVMVWGNDLSGRALTAVSRAANGVQGQFFNVLPMVHDAWIEKLILDGNEPFWVCDTDMVFFGPVPDPKPGTVFSGRFEPEFLEEWTGTRHMARLHTCLMYFEPRLLRPAMRAWLAQFPAPWGMSAQVHLVRQNFVPLAGSVPLFYDTCAGLWHANVGGVRFDAETDGTFEHLHCGTYADLVSRCQGLADLATVHKTIYRDNGQARSLRAWQERYYESRAPGCALVIDEHNNGRVERSAASGDAAYKQKDKIYAV